MKRLCWWWGINFIVILNLYYQGMWLSLIPFLIGTIYLQTHKKPYLVLVLLMGLQLALSSQVLQQVEGVGLVKDLNYQGRQQVISLQGQSYLLKGTLEPGYYQLKGEVSSFAPKAYPGAFSPRDYYLGRGLKGELHLEEADLLRRHTPLAHGWIEAIRLALIKRYGSLSDLLLSMFTGAKEVLSREQENLFRLLGISHLLVVSGYHVSLMNKLLDKLLHRLWCPFFLRKMVTLSVYVLLLILTQGHPSLVRLLLIFLIKLVSILLRRPYDPLNALGLATLIMLVYQPSYALSTSFLLGFGALGGLFSLKGIALVRVYGGIYPLLSHFSLGLSPWFIPYGVVAMTSLGYLMPMALLGLFIPEEFSLYHQLVSLLLKTLFGWGDRLSQGARLLTFRPLALLSVIGYYGYFAFWLFGREKLGFRRKGYQVLALFLCLGLFIGGRFLSQEAYRNTLVIYNVGMGDGMIITTNQGRSILVDTGYGKVMEKIVAYRRITPEGVFISHWHQDHAGAGSSFGRPLVSYGPGDQLGAGDRYELDNVQVEVIWPRRGYQGSENNQSLVLKVTLDQASFLLTGDIEEEAEALGSWPKVDLLKIPHHGSKTSTTKQLLEQTQPKLAIISVGENTYGHPHEQVLQRLRAYGIPYITTREQGSILVKVKNNKIKLKTLP